MSIVQVVLLAVVQGLAELLPVSSSAHVIVAEKLLGLDPSAPAMTFLLVMLHTGTMGAVLVYFWPKWRAILVAPPAAGAGRLAFLRQLVIATGVTGVIGLGLKLAIEHTAFRGAEHAEIEQLFANLPLMATSLASVGLLIIASGRRRPHGGDAPLTDATAAVVGAVQGLCLPFRGFSRSGATISVGMLRQLPRELSESFSFALAVLLTPAAIFLEVHRLVKATAASNLPFDAGLLAPGLIGMVASFAAGLGALRWLSAWLAAGRWHFFGYYCLAAALVVAGLAAAGY